jgi:hypothetical protein
VAHHLFNFTGAGPEQAAALLEAKMWGIGPEEHHRDEVAPGDLALIYVAEQQAFLGCSELGTAVHEWTPSEAAAYPGDSPSGVLLSDVEEWDSPLPMQIVVQRLDPTGSNPLVRSNAFHGFRMGLVRITSNEYETAVALGKGHRGTSWNDPT